MQCLILDAIINITSCPILIFWFRDDNNVKAILFDDITRKIFEQRQKIFTVTILRLSGK